MKHIVFSMLIYFVLVQNIYGQITKGEYFFDNEPGINKGIPLAVTIGDSIARQYDLNINSLSDGFHTLSMRFAQNNLWGLTSTRIFYKVPAISGNTTTTLSAAEYFFDTDPGIGKGIPLATPNADSVMQLYNFDLSTLQNGFHTISIRFKNSKNQWGLSTTRVFYISGNTVSTNTKIAGAEYFFDADPGIGKGIPLATPNADSVMQLYNFDLSTLQNGFHTISIRFKNSKNQWGLSTTRVFYISGNTVSTNTKIVGAEYFIDTDPGVGKGTAVSVTAADSIFLNPLNYIPQGLSLAAHKFCLRFRNNRGEWGLTTSKDFNVCTTYGAEADFDYIQDNNNVTFLNTSKYSNSYSWNFGDGASATNESPYHEYTKGNYNVCLSVINSCANDTICKSITVSGISNISPSIGGNTGATTVEIEGFGFISGTTITLKRSGQPNLLGDTVIIVNSNRLRTSLDLRGKALGKYDVVVKIPNLPEYTIINGFEITNGINPSMWANITGRNGIRTGRENTYTITYGNNGNIDAVVVPLTITNIPLDATIKLNFDTLKLSQVTNDTNFLKYSSISALSLDSNTNTYFLPLYVPYVRAGGTGSFDIKISIPSTRNFEIGVKIFNPLLESTALLNRGVLDCPTSFDCNSTAVLEAGKEVLKEIVTDQLSDWSDCIGTSIGTAWDIYEGVSELIKKETSTVGAYLFGTNMAVGIGKSAYHCAVAAGGTAFPETKLLKFADKILDFVNKGNTSFEIISELRDCHKKSENCNNAPLEPVTSNSIAIAAGNSYDPNEKIGTGSSSRPYLNDKQPLTYKILFENSPQASLAAQIVKVTDTLDKEKLNLSTFRFTSFSLGNRNFDLDGVGTSFIYNLDLRPNLNLKLRLAGSIDTIEGIVYWEFQSIDPITNQITEDPIIGFLPPNVIAPQGDGSVSFIVNAKDNLVDGDSIKNKAYIVFDNNPTIVTNDWKNKYDFAKPSSFVNILPNSSLPTFTVSWAGVDIHSGVKEYTIFVSKNDSAYVPWIINTNLTQAVFTGVANTNYKFYSISTDYAGNTEDSKSIYESSTNTSLSTSTVNLIEDKNIVLFPNPFTDNLYLNFLNKEYDRSDFNVTITNVNGSIENTFSNVYEIPTNNLVPGIYIVKIQMGEFIKNFKVIKVQ
jgi:hypothetical protein